RGRGTAVVADLIEELIGRGMELEHPSQTRARLVEDIGNPVRAALAEGVETILEANGGELVRKEHLRRGIARNEQVFGIIGGVVPATRGFGESAIGQRTAE